MANILDNCAHWLMNGHQKASTQQQQFQKMMAAVLLKDPDYMRTAVYLASQEFIMM